MKKTVVFLLLATLPGEGLEETVNLVLPASPEHRRAEFTNDATVARENIRKFAAVHGWDSLTAIQHKKLAVK